MKRTLYTSDDLAAKCENVLNVINHEHLMVQLSIALSIALGIMDTMDHIASQNPEAVPNAFEGMLDVKDDMRLLNAMAIRAITTYGVVEAPPH